MQSEHLGQLRQLVVERFEGDRLRFKHFRHTIAGTEDVLEAEYDHGARRRAVYQAQLRLQHQHTGGLTANQCPRHIKAMFRQQLIKRVA